MEVIKDTDQVTIINDSKSTNPHSTYAAINQLAPLNKRLILILGGDTKGLIFSKNLLNLPPDATCYIYGKDKDKIYQEISFENTFIFETLKEHKGPIISESGIKNEADAKYIYEKTGIKNFLIGESLLKSDNPADLIKKFKQITQ